MEIKLIGAMEFSGGIDVQEFIGVLETQRFGVDAIYLLRTSHIEPKMGPNAVVWRFVAEAHASNVDIRGQAQGHRRGLEMNDIQSQELLVEPP